MEKTLVQENGVLLRKEVEKSLREIGEADIVIGIPSYNNASTIGHVVNAAQAGLAKYFSDYKGVLVNSDGGSTDGTMDVVREATFKDLQHLLLRHRSYNMLKIVTPYHGLPGKGSSFRTIFEIASRLGARACAVVDSDLKSISPEWIELLVRPVLHEGYDFVAPYYLRHKYDGTITNTIVYPVTRALYGKRIRQPIGGDFGFSGRLAAHYLEKDVWQTDVARFGIDIWMTTTALAGGFKVCQSFLGAKIHDAKDPGSDLSSMLHQVFSAVLDLMTAHAETWKSVRGSEPIRLFGFQYGVGLEPINVNLERMVEMFKLGARELAPLHREILSKESMAEVEEAALCSSEDTCLISDETWARIIYDYALSANRGVMNREHMLKSLTPLYLGKVASFVSELKDSDSAEVEQRLESLALCFENMKPYLIERWDV